MPQCEAGEGMPDVAGHFLYPDLIQGVHGDIILVFGKGTHGDDWSVQVDTRLLLVSASMRLADVELHLLDDGKTLAFPRIASIEVRPRSTYGRKSQQLDIAFAAGSMSFVFRRCVHVRVIRRFGRPYSDEDGNVLRLEDWVSDDN